MSNVIWATLRMKRKVIYKIEIEGYFAYGNDTETFEEFMQSILGKRRNFYCYRCQQLVSRYGSSKNVIFLRIFL